MYIHYRMYCQISSWNVLVKKLVLCFFYRNMKPGMFYQNVVWKKLVPYVRRVKFFFAKDLVLERKNYPIVDMLYNESFFACWKLKWFRDAQAK